jgi:putative aldouronate transport system substrate-binding protein
MNDGIEGENFKADANGLTAYSINPDSTENKALANELNGFFNMGTYVQGIKYYTLQKGSIMASNEEKHQELMKKDQEYAVKNPAVPFSSDTATEKGATLDNIIVDARIKYISGQIDKDGWEKAINEWLNSGGKDIISELSKLNKENK